MSQFSSDFFQKQIDEEYNKEHKRFDSHYGKII